MLGIILEELHLYHRARRWIQRRISELHIVADPQSVGAY